MRALTFPRRQFSADKDAHLRNIRELETWAREHEPKTGDTASRPSASDVGEGAAYYDTTLHQPIWSNGSIWTDAMGAPV